MSIKLMSAAWELNLPATEKMVLLCLCDHANDGGTCWPSMAGMARKCSMDQRSVRRLIRKLEARGLVQTDIARGRSSQNVYTVTLGELKPDTQPPGQSAPPDTCAENRTITTLKPDTQPPKPSRTIIEPSNNKTRAREVPDDFWPVVSAGTKTAQAMAEWSQEEIEREVERFVSYHQARGNKYSDWQRAWSTWALSPFQNKSKPDNRGGSLAEIGDEVRRLYGRDN